jgi:hypothetical protein
VKGGRRVVGWGNYGKDNRKKRMLTTLNGTDVAGVYGAHSVVQMLLCVRYDVPLKHSKAIHGSTSVKRRETTRNKCGER